MVEDLRRASDLKSQTSTYYNIYSTNPTHDNELNRYTYNWQLVLPPGDDCSTNTFAIGSNPWQALWTHNCQGAPGETIEVSVQREDQQVRFEAPALGPADVTPISGP